MNALPLTKAVYTTANSRSTFKVRSIEEVRRLYEAATVSEMKVNDFEQIGKSNCYKDNKTGSFMLLSAFDNVSKGTCEDNLTVDKNSNLAGVTVTVMTEERLPSGVDEYRFRDTWGFSFKSDKLSYSEAGSVAKSIEDRDGFGVGLNGVKQFDYCINIAKLVDEKAKAKAKDNITIPFVLSAQDIGDQNQPTKVIIQYQMGCNYIKGFSQYKAAQVKMEPGDNKLIDAILSSARNKEPSVISLIVDNNSKVFYDNVRVPIRLEYKADNLSRIEYSALNIVLGDNRTKIMDNFTDKFPSSEPGNDNITHILKWDNFTFPAIPRSIYDNVTDRLGDKNEAIKFEVEIKFVNKRDGAATLAYSPYAAQNNDIMLIPLFELRDVYLDDAWIDGRRYGDTLEDYKGGDLWGRKAFLQWLKDDGKLVFNDLSSIHGARVETSGRCILGHASHTSGVEVDVRYANPIGGVSSKDNLSKTYKDLKLGKDNFTYTDNKKPGEYIYSGWNSTSPTEGLVALSNRAKTEFKDSKSDKAILNKFKDWIITNRFMMEYYYDNLTERFGSNPKIFYGKGLVNDGDTSNDNGFYNMMHNGAFHDDATNLVGTWDKNNYEHISHLNGHNNHWHITAPIRKE